MCVRVYLCTRIVNMSTTAFFNASTYETNSGVIHLYFIVKESWRGKIKVLLGPEFIINHFVYAIGKSKKTR